MKTSIKTLIPTGTFREQRVINKCLWIILATFTLLVFFYATTIVMSVIYPLDSAMITF